MRTIRYSVMNKETKKRVFVSYSQAKCEEYLNTLQDKENYTICYKWFSI